VIVEAPRRRVRLPVFRTELTKQLVRPRTYVALGITALIPVIFAVAFKLNPPDPAGDGGFFFRFVAQSGLLIPFASLEVMSRFLLIVVVALFAGETVAGEANSGNLRFLLVRPVARARLLGAKLAVVALLAFVATALISVVGAIVGGITFGWHPVTVFFDEFAVRSVSELFVNLGVATVYIAWTMGIVVTFGFMVSTLTDSATGAISAAVGLAVVSQILDEIESLGAIRTVLPLHYIDDWDDLLFEGTFNTDMVEGMLLPIPYMLVFSAIAFWWFRRKDILS
jgi:ABC-2 type transport system permease protein